MRGRTCSNRSQATVTPDFPHLENSKRSEETNKQIRSPSWGPSFGGGIRGTPTLDLIFSVKGRKENRRDLPFFVRDLKSASPANRPMAAVQLVGGSLSSPRPSEFKQPTAVLSRPYPLKRLVR